MNRVIRAIALGAVGLFVVMLIVGFVYQGVSTRNDMHRIGDGGQFHVVNGKSLLIKCVGSARPTVVFEPGAGRMGLATSGAGLAVEQQQASHIGGRDACCLH